MIKHLHALVVIKCLGCFFSVLYFWGGIPISLQGYYFSMLREYFIKTWLKQKKTFILMLYISNCLKKFVFSCKCTAYLNGETLLI